MPGVLSAARRASIRSYSQSRLLLLSSRTVACRTSFTSADIAASMSAAAGVPSGEVKIRSNIGAAAELDHHPISISHTSTDSALSTPLRSPAFSHGTPSLQSIRSVLSNLSRTSPPTLCFINHSALPHSAGRRSHVRLSTHLSNFAAQSSLSRRRIGDRSSFLDSSSSPYAVLAGRPSPLPFKLASEKSQSRSHAGHSHDHHGHHHHHGPNVYLTSKDKTDAGVRITRIGLLVNLLSAIIKGLGGVIFSSQALVADAFHSLTDLVADFLTLSTVSFARKKPTERFPNGYGKIESLGSVGVSGLLLFGGLAMGYSSLISLYAEFFVENAHEFLEHHAHGHGHHHHHVGPDLNAAWLALGSILVKEWLYRATMKVAKERKSTVLASNAVHHRIDSLTSIVALLAIGGSHIFKDATFFDPVGGLIVSLMVISAGFNNTRIAVMELVDVGLDEETKHSVSDAAAKALAQRQESVKVRDIGGIKSGQNYLVELALEVPAGTTVEEQAEIEKEVREVVGSEVRGVKRIKFRFMGAGSEVLSEFVSEEAQERAEAKEDKKEQ